jgi:hypothetical protein
MQRDDSVYLQHDDLPELEQHMRRVIQALGS